MAETENEKPKVLYVDDEEPNLVVFEARMSKHADVRVALSGAEGLEILAKEEIPIIISDQVMPEMTGNQFLAEVKRRYPDTMRMMMTAYTNFEDVVEAINSGQIMRFIKKPWEPDDLVSAVINAHQHYEVVKENKELTEKLLTRERMSAVGQVASNLVNELDAIAFSLDVGNTLRGRIDAGLKSDFETMMRGVARLKLTVESLRTFATGGGDMELQTEKVDLNEFIPSLFPKLDVIPVVSGLTKLDFVASNKQATALVDKLKLEQVLLNLVISAAEAAPKGSGQVKVTLEKLDDRAHISVVDNGAGIPEEVIDRVWSGFFSAKNPDNGAGLGLFMSRKILRAHAGDLSFSYRPESGGGCTLTVDLPTFDY